MLGEIIVVFSKRIFAFCMPAKTEKSANN